MEPNEISFQKENSKHSRGGQIRTGDPLQIQGASEFPREGLVVWTRGMPGGYRENYRHTLETL